MGGNNSDGSLRYNLTLFPNLVRQDCDAVLAIRRDCCCGIDGAVYFIFTHLRFCQSSGRRRQAASGEEKTGRMAEMRDAKKKEEKGERQAELAIWRHQHRANQPYRREREGKNEV